MSKLENDAILKELDRVIAERNQLRERVAVLEQAIEVLRDTPDYLAVTDCLRLLRKGTEHE